MLQIIPQLQPPQPCLLYTSGASSGIGAKTKELLIQQGHKVINIDLKDGDICVNLASQEGRQSAVDQLHTMCPDGLDGMICNAGVSGACGNLGLIISLNRCV